MELDQLTNDDGLMIRSLQIRAGNAAKREFTGIGVPYGEIYETPWFREQFDPGSVEGDTAKIYWRHREVVGKVIASRDTAEGFEITAKLSDTALGRDAWTLLEDGVIDQLSIGFEPLEYRVTEDDVIVHTKVRAREFSLVPDPAYSEAKVSAIRAADKNPTPPKGKTVETETVTRADLQPLNESLDDLTRQLQVLGQQREQGPVSGAQWRTMGDFMKAIADGDEAAAAFHRAYTGATTADTVMKDSFVGDYIKLVDERRRLVNTFTRGTLPAEGKSVDYTALKSDTTKVAEQVNEGDDLQFGKVQLEDKNAPVKTYGGWTELSVQAIQRATVPALNTTMRAMAIKYAKTTEAGTRTAYLAKIAELVASADAGASLTLPGAATATDWLNAIVDAAVLYEDRGFTIGGLHVAQDVFKELNGLKDGDNRLMNVYGDGVNQVGQLQLKQLQGNLGSVTVQMLPGVAAGTASFYDPLAVETLESPGAPAQLQDENIINLTKQFSLYGFAAVLVPFPGGILPIERSA